LQILWGFVCNICFVCACIFYAATVSHTLHRLKRERGQDRPTSSTTYPRCKATFTPNRLQIYPLNVRLQGGYYEGGVADGKYHGWGRLTDTLGNVLEGNWVHGQLDG
jgi:hypothetical protein